MAALAFAELPKTDFFWLQPKGLDAMLSCASDGNLGEFCTRLESFIFVVFPMSAADRARARASLGRAGWRRYEKAEVHIEMLEDLVKDYRWCAYTKDFAHISKFSSEQRLAEFARRYCLEFSNSARRAALTPSVEMTDAVLHAHAERARIIVVSINDGAGVAAPSDRAMRAAGRTEQDFDELVEDVAEMHADGHEGGGDAAGDDDDEQDGDEGAPDGAGTSRKRAAARAKNKKSRRNKKAATMTAEQLQQRARDRAERDARLTKEALDEYIMKKIPSLANYDENVHSDELTRDQGDRTLATWSEWEETNSAWATALDDGEPDEERRKAAASDINIIIAEQQAVVLIADPVERDVKLKLLVRMKNRLAKIAAGTAGFSDLSRGDWRQQGCSKLMVDGTKYTCIQDALLVVCRRIGAQVSKTEVYADLVKPNKEAVVADVCCYVREKLNLDMVCVSHGPGAALARRKGGLGFATLQLDKGSYIVVVQATLADGGVERHALAFLSDFKHPAYRNHLGALVDNDPRVEVRLLQPSDRASVAEARKVFDGLFWTATRVDITSVWQVSKPPTLDEE